MTKKSCLNCKRLGLTTPATVSSLCSPCHNIYRKATRLLKAKNPVCLHCGCIQGSKRRIDPEVLEYLSHLRK